MRRVPYERTPGAPAPPESDPVDALAREATRALTVPSTPGSGLGEPAGGCAPVALVRADDGSFHLGRLLRTGIAGLGTCALRVALARARAAGHSGVTHALLAWPTPASSEAPPLRCDLGLCLQSLLVLAPEATLAIQDGASPPRVVDARALLPGPFDRFDPENPR
jgi:cytidine deaminase